MRIRKDFTADIFEESALTVRSIGPEKTIHALKEARNSLKDTEGPTKDFIVQTVCKQLNITRASLDGNAHGRRIEAITLIFILLKKHLGYSIDQTRFCFKNPRSKSNFSKYERDFNALDPEHPLDKKKLGEMEKIDRKISLFKKSNEHGT
jgi:hypothetical protein